MEIFDNIKFVGKLLVRTNSITFLDKLDKEETKSYFTGQTINNYILIK